jgi:hypothetical protein
MLSAATRRELVRSCAPRGCRSREPDAVPVQAACTEFDKARKVAQVAWDAYVDRVQELRRELVLIEAEIARRDDEVRSHTSTKQPSAF